MLTMDQVALENQTVLIREDFNVPIQAGKITHTARIDAALPTLNKAIKAGAKVIVMSHLGRPKEGQFDANYSLEPVRAYLSQCLSQEIPLFQLGHAPQLKPGEVALLENVRFLEGEEHNSPVLAKQLASLGQIFVMDAFAVAHREAASTCGVAQFASIACAGPLLHKELEAVAQVLVNSKKPVLAIVGGSKVSTKLDLLNHLLDRVDILVVGGGIANTFLSALNFPIGASLYEPELVPVAKELWQKAKALGKTIWLPIDVVVADAIDAKSGSVKLREDVLKDDKIFDIGPKAQASLAAYILQANTILWNGPVGVFECAPFAQGTQALAQAIAHHHAFSVAGGGDTLAAIEQFQVGEKISYLSTGGGAFLEALEGKTLPAVAALEAHQKGKINADSVII